MAFLPLAHPARWARALAGHLSRCQTPTQLGSSGGAGSWQCSQRHTGEPTAGGMGAGAELVEQQVGSWRPPDSREKPKANSNGERTSHLDYCALATCVSQRMVFLNGRRISRHSLRSVWQRVAGFFSESFWRERALRQKPAILPKLSSF